MNIENVRRLELLRKAKKQAVDAAKAALKVASDQLDAISAELAVAASPLQPGDYLQDSWDNYWQVNSIDGILREAPDIEKSHFVYRGCLIKNDGSFDEEEFIIHAPFRKLEPDDPFFLKQKTA